MSIEAMEQALEALEAGDWYIGQLELLVYTADDTDTHRERTKVQAAITALRAAIEQAKPWVKTYANGEPQYTTPKEQPEQEPVAWMHNLIEGNVITHRPADIDRHPERWTALYTAPPRREWQGLTDDEKRLFSSWLDEKSDDAVFRAIESKLKDKNT